MISNRKIVFHLFGRNKAATKLIDEARLGHDVSEALPAQRPYGY